MNGDLKLTFVLKVLQQYFENVKEAQQMLLVRMKINDTKELSKSISSTASESGAGATGSLKFKEYGRMIDMGVGRGHPLGGLTTTKIALKASHAQGLATIKNRGRKPKKFYSPIAYGNLTWLQNKLLYGYTEETIAMLKKEMTNGNQNTSSAGNP